MGSYFHSRSMIIRVLSGLVLVSLLFGAGVSAISITATGDISNWAFIPKTENSKSTDISLSGSCDKSCSVYVIDNLDGGKPAGTVGHMAEYITTSSSYVSDGLFLNANMTVVGNDWGGNVTGYEVVLGPSNQKIEGKEGSGSFGPVYIWVNQTVGINDPKLSNDHVYRTVITFVIAEDV